MLFGFNTGHTLFVEFIVLQLLLLFVFVMTSRIALVLYHYRNGW